MIQAIDNAKVAGGHFVSHRYVRISVVTVNNFDIQSLFRFGG